MSDEPKPNGRKYFLAKLCIGICTVNQVGAFVLAFLGKLSGDFVTISTIFNGAIFGVLGAFTAGNAYTTGKAADAGLLSPPRTEAG